MYITGLIKSRRLGSSLGLDLLKSKICSFDCIYCEVAKTTTKTIERAEYTPTKDVLSELEQYINTNKAHIDFITFSGSGEPTLHSKLGFIISEIKKMTSIPVCVLTNSSTMTESTVKEELSLADLIVPSMDAVSKDIVKIIDKPLPDFNMESVIEALASFKKTYKTTMWLEILLCQGINDSDEELSLLAQKAKYINPDKVHVHTLDRPSLAGTVLPATKETLQKLASMIGTNAIAIV